MTVVIRCHSQGHVLAEAIQGALGQTHPRIEIIVVDDGSTDTTSVVASAYPGVRYVHQENRGLGAARNCGVRESSGECLVFLDCDDRLHPDTTELCYTATSFHIRPLLYSEGMSWKLSVVSRSTRAGKGRKTTSCARG